MSAIRTIPIGLLAASSLLFLAAPASEPWASAAGVVSGRVLVNGAPPKRPLRLGLQHSSSRESGLRWDAVFADPRTRIGVTDRDGRFRFGELPPGWSGTIYLPKGVKFREPDEEGPGGALSLPLDAPVEGVLLDLVRQPRLVGRVSGSAGVSPNARARVWRITFQGPDGKLDRWPLDGTTDAHGRFEIILDDPERTILEEFDGGEVTVEVRNAALRRANWVTVGVPDLRRNRDGDFDLGEIELLPEPRGG